MKRLITGVFLVLAVISANVSFVWAIVEFILHLVKDKVFNWYSVWLFVFSLVLTIVLYIIYAVFELKHHNAKREAFKTRTGKSKWQERLEQAAKQRGANTD